MQWPKRRNLASQPYCIPIPVAGQACIRTISGAKTLCHFRIRNVVYLVRPGRKKQRFHDAWHMARDATACLRTSSMVCVKLWMFALPLVALQTHLVGVL